MDSDFTKESAIEHLKENWDNVKSKVGFLGPQKIYKFYKILTYKEIHSILSTFESYTLMKSTHIQKKSNPTLVQHIRDVFQLDYIHVKELAGYNDNFGYIFCAIDVFSKRVWVNPTEFCNGESSIESMNIILNSMNIAPKTVVCDGGSEFNNKLFSKFLKKLGIRLIFSKSNQKASTIERFQQTLQKKIYLYITQNESLRFIHVLNDVVCLYNNTHHRFLKCTPFEVETSRDIRNNLMLKHAKKLFNLKKQKPNFAIGDVVRISLKKTPFHRAYNLQRTYERFIIRNINKILPIPRYELKDELGRDIDGNFLGGELVKINIDRYRSNVIKKRKKKGKIEYLHRFKGYSNDFDLWQTVEQSDPLYY